MNKTLDFEFLLREAEYYKVKGMWLMSSLLKCTQIVNKQLSFFNKVNKELLLFKKEQLSFFLQRQTAFII